MWLMRASDHYDSATHGVAEVSVGLAFAFSGLVAWDRRPGNRVGPLLVLVAVGWMGQALTAANNSYVFSLGFVAYAVFFAAICALLVVFPTGRVESRVALVLVILGAVEGLIFPLSLFVVQPSDAGSCPRCPESPFLVVHSDGVADVFTALPLAVAVVLAPAVIALLIVRFRRASVTRRRALAPVAIAGGLATLAFVTAVVVTRFAPDERGAVSAVSEFSLLLVPIGFLVGLLREQLFRSAALAGLVSALAAALTPADVEAALAEALRDPRLRVGFWIAQRGIYVDAEGRALGSDADGLDETVVDREGRRIAIVRHDPALSEDPALLASVGAAAELALDRARLEAELRLRLTELAASRARLVSAADAARRQIERDLHDGAQQRLVALALALRLARARSDDPDAVRGALDDCSEQLATALEELRELARGIHPAVLTERGLVPALAALADRAPLPVEVHVDLPERLEPPVEVALYFAAAEALTNVVKHARASRVTIAGGHEDGGRAVAIAIGDDGIGGADPDAGSGLRGLRDRLDAVNGSVEVRSAGGGTTVVARVPVAIGVPA